MGAVQILVIELSSLDPVGNLGEWLTAAGAETTVVRPVERELPDPTDFQGVIVLGGEMGVYDDAEHPWLSQVRSLLSTALGQKQAVLGIGLGAQLLAVVTGGQVRPVAAGPEVGTLLVAKRDSAAKDPLFELVPLTPDVLQMHADEISELPPGAKLLAASPNSDIQAFRVGNCGYGLQFHIETTTDSVLRWASAAPELAAAARPGQLEREHLDEFHEDLAETWAPVVERFVQLAITPPEERGRDTSLPLV